MESLINFLLSYVLIYKYAAIFIITYLGALAFPMPSGTVVAASAAFATQGYLNPVLVYLIAVCGNVAGDNSGYWLSRRYGVRVLHTLGLRKVVGSGGYLTIKKEVESHPVLIVYFSRFMTGIAPTVNVICGTTRLSFRRYFIFEFLGECTEVAFFFAAGYLLGTNWEYINEFSGESWIVILGGVFLTYLAFKLFFKKRM